MRRVGQRPTPTMTALAPVEHDTVLGGEPFLPALPETQRHVEEDSGVDVVASRRRRAEVGQRGRLVRRYLVLADGVALLLAALVADLVGQSSMWYVVGVAFSIVVAKLLGLYARDEERTHHSTVDDIVPLFHVATATGFFLLVGSSVLGSGLSSEDVGLFWLVSLPTLVGARAGARALSRRSTSYIQNTIIVGAGDIGQLIARKILQHPEYGIELVGFVDASPKAPRGDLRDLSILGGPSDLEGLVDRLDVDRIIIAFSGESSEDTLALVRSLRDRSVQIDIVPRLFEAMSPSTEMHAIEGLPVMGLPAVRISRTSRLLKRVFDLLVASALLVVLLPLLAYLWIRVKRSSPGPALFRQERLGMNQRPFEMLKFRTMYVDTDDAAHRDYIRATMDAAASPTENGLYKLSRDDAVTRFGAWLRRTSLDELPQLWNVIRGQMSLVGPRPCIVYETEFFERHHFERFLVPQGVTGLWQVEGRALMTPKEGLDLDVAYARGWSPLLDLSLILRTVSQLVRRDRAC